MFQVFHCFDSNLGRSLNTIVSQRITLWTAQQRTRKKIKIWLHCWISHRRGILNGIHVAVRTTWRSQTHYYILKSHCILGSNIISIDAFIYIFIYTSSFIFNALVSIRTFFNKGSSTPKQNSTCFVHFLKNNNTLKICIMDQIHEKLVNGITIIVGQPVPELLIKDTKNAI